MINNQAVFAERVMKPTDDDRNRVSCVSCWRVVALCLSISIDQYRSSLKCSISHPPDCNFYAPGRISEEKRCVYWCHSPKPQHTSHWLLPSSRWKVETTRFHTIYHYIRNMYAKGAFIITSSSAYGESQIEDSNTCVTHPLQVQKSSKLSFML